MLKDVSRGTIDMTLKGIIEECDWQVAWSEVGAGCVPCLLKFKTLQESSTSEFDNRPIPSDTVRYCPILSDTGRAYRRLELCPILSDTTPIPPILSI